MPEQKLTAPEKAPPPPKRYKVLSRGISTPHVIGGAVYQGQIVTADDLGDAERVRTLLRRKAIEVADAAD